MNDRRLINHVREHRYQAGEMTQKELADRAGVSRQSIIAVEQGRFRPSVELALRLAEVFEVAVEDLFELVQEGDGS